MKSEFLSDNDLTTVCHWKETANYYDVHVDGEINQGAALYYKTPSKLASSIKDHIAFWRGLQIIEV